MEYNIPITTKESIDRYAQDRIPTGDFLYAVLTNNLFEAVGRADMSNRYCLFDICKYIYNEIPYTCWGSIETVEKWLGHTEE